MGDAYLEQSEEDDDGQCVVYVQTETCRHHRELTPGDILSGRDWGHPRLIPSGLAFNDVSESDVLQLRAKKILEALGAEISAKDLSNIESWFGEQIAAREQAERDGVFDHKDHCASDQERYVRVVREIAEGWAGGDRFYHPHGGLCDDMGPEKEMRAARDALTFLVGLRARCRTVVGWGPATIRRRLFWRTVTRPQTSSIGLLKKAARGERPKKLRARRRSK